MQDFRAKSHGQVWWLMSSVRKVHWGGGEKVYFCLYSLHHLWLDLQCQDVSNRVSDITVSCLYHTLLHLLHNPHKRSSLYSHLHCCRLFMSIKSKEVNPILFYSHAQACVSHSFIFFSTKHERTQIQRNTIHAPLLSRFQVWIVPVSRTIFNIIYEMSW